MSDPFRTRDHVPDFDAISDDYRRLSDQARATYRSSLDMPYGEHPDERLDLFFPPQPVEGAPIHLFVHGGYWRANRKEDYAFVANPVVAAGGIAAIVEYSLMPGARMDRLVDQVRRAARWLRTNAPNFGGDADRVTASGHSAGAHLAFYLTARGPHELALPATGVSDALLVSGIYDLAPLRHSFLQEEIGLTETEAARWSPLSATASSAARLQVVVGEYETAPFHEQAAALKARHGANLTTLGGLNHMSIMREVGMASALGGNQIGQMVSPFPEATT